MDKNPAKLNVRVLGNLRGRWDTFRDFVARPAPLEFLGHISFVREMQTRGVAIRNVLDIGANSGEWTKWISRTIKPTPTFYLFEPQQKHGHDLQKLGVWFPVLLSDQVKSVGFYSTGGTGDSYFVEKSESYQDVIPEPMITSTLKSLSGIPSQIDLVKIDTQGSELDILSGFGNLIQTVSLIILEIPIISNNEGAPTFDDYMTFMRKLGFSAWRVIGENRKGSSLAQVDIGFVNGETRRLLEEA
jgi:FkbM family methyltransferase